MNNTQKNRWKIILIVVASVIVGASLWYSNILVNKMQLEERQKVKLWAEAIQKKAKLVKYANTLFNQIGGDERQKVQLWADATKMLASNDVSNIDLGFIFKLIQDNQTVPVILAAVICTLAVPGFEICTVCVLVKFATTLPKLIVPGETVRPGCAG